MSDIYSELKEVRKLRRRGGQSDLVEKYKLLFKRLPKHQQRAMTECYINGLSYADCGRKIHYCERHIKRIVRRSIERLYELERGS